MHDYETCQDEDCTELWCQVYREGYGLGFADGFTAAAELRPDEVA